MNNLLITSEIMLVVVRPLLVLYLKGTWPLRATIPCLLTIPILWYLTYSPLHELSHVAGTYLVGGKVTFIKLIPSFWIGEFGRAWITSEGVTNPWYQLITTLFPYLFDIACIVIGICVLSRALSRNAFVIGFLFMLLCLRPAFDLLCETVAFVSGDKGDFYHIDLFVGSFAMWSFLLASNGFSFFMIFVVLRRFHGFPQPVQA